MPFGLKNAPATFLKLMTQVFKDCSSFAEVYIDHILLFSNIQHHEHRSKVLQALRKSGVMARPSKYE